MSARSDFKKAWGEYRLNNFKGLAYVDKLANADWDELATYRDGLVLETAIACAELDTNSSTVMPDGSIAPWRISRAVALEVRRRLRPLNPPGIQCQYFID